jgi:hypothetical protein
MSQTSYQIYTDRAFAGQVYDLNDNTVIITMENPSNSLYFGRGVAKISGNANGVDLLAANTDTFMGVVIRDLTQPSAGYFPVNSAVPVIRKGMVWVEVEENVTPDDVPLMRVDAVGGKLPGNFCKTADGVHTVALTTARFVLVDSFTDKNSVRIALLDLSLI